MTTEHADLQSEDLYMRLGVSPTSSTAEIRHAYRQLLRAYPPERYPEEFKRVREAYETLSGEESRASYDAKPDPAVAGPLQRGMQALGEKAYDIAERSFKQVLLVDPQLAYVRNFLGLAIAYQGRHENALEQFRRITGLPGSDAAWHGNEGHVCLELERFSEAKDAFQRAIDRATDNPVSYYCGLADALVGLEQYRDAVAVIEKGIHADGSVDFQDLDYFTKLLHISIRTRRAEDVRHTLLRMKEIAGDEEQARLLAYKAGSMAKQLLKVELFDYAHAISAFAKDVQPADPDYDALLQLSAILHHRTFEKGLVLVRHHEAFVEGEWLDDIKQWFSEYCRTERQFGGMTPIKSAPDLATINGIGTVLYWAEDPDAETRSHTSTLYFAFLFIPLIPLGRYRVVPMGDGRTRFLGKMPLGTRDKWHLALVAGAVLWMLMAGSSGRSTVYEGSTLPEASPATAVASPDLASQDGNTERALLESRKQDLERRMAELESVNAEMKRIDSQTDAIEAGNSAFSVNDAEYDRLVQRYNRLVREYNAQRDVLMAEAAQLDRDIDLYNQRFAK